MLNLWQVDRLSILLEGLEDGAVVLQETAGDKQVVFAVIGDMTLAPAFEAAAFLKTEGIGSKIVLHQRHDNSSWEVGKSRAAKSVRSLAP